MAAIDKLYLHSYEELREFRRWVLIYYAKVIAYMYDGWTMDYDKYEKNLDWWTKRQIEISERCHNLELGKYETIDEAITNLRKFHKENGNYDCPLSEAENQVWDIIARKNRPYEEWRREYSFPIMNCPSKIDRKLKWICPLPFVRDYLHKQCGVNPKWEWLYRIFWKGKEFV